MLAAQIRNGNPGLVLFQNADDLIFGKPAALHLWSSRLGQSLRQTGLDAGGNVRSYLTSILTRDLRDIADIEKLTELPKFVRLLAEHSGQLVNYSQFAAGIGVTHKTGQRYVGLLEQVFLVSTVQPWFTNALKRIAKTPKLHFLDSGLLATVRGLTFDRVKADHGPFGALLESFVFSETLKLVSTSDLRLTPHHFRDRDMREVDIVLERDDGMIVGIEVKASATVKAGDFGGLKALAEACGEPMPQTPEGRSGDLGEILATELVEEEASLRVSVRRLRYKDGRNMAMSGDDFIGAGYDAAGEKLWLLKGEVKSNKVLGKATVTSARKVLDRDNGRCTPDSLLFVANRLLESNDPDDNALGRSLRDEVGLKSLRADRIDHMLFTGSGNGPHASLKNDLAATGRRGKTRYIATHGGRSMRWKILASSLILTCASACANTPGSDSAVCDGTRASRKALASALVEDGGAQSQRAGLRLLDQMVAGCG